MSKIARIEKEGRAGGILNEWLNHVSDAKAKINVIVVRLDLIKTGARCSRTAFTVEAM